MGKWNLGVKREIFKHSSVVTLSVVQLRVPGDHRSSGYLRIASLSYKFQPTTHELFWFLVRKLFPPEEDERRVCVAPGLFLAGPFHRN